MDGATQGGQEWARGGGEAAACGGRRRPGLEGQGWPYAALVGGTTPAQGGGQIATIS
jgi:hypothetical protein